MRGIMNGSIAWTRGPAAQRRSVVRMSMIRELQAISRPWLSCEGRKGD
jgi:hypothetical protein